MLILLSLDSCEDKWEIMHIKNLDQCLAQNENLINGSPPLLVIIIIISLDQENLGKRVARLWLNYMNLSSGHCCPSSLHKALSPKCFGWNVSVRSLQIAGAWFALVMSYSVTSLSPAEIFFYLVDTCFKVQDWAGLRRQENEEPPLQLEVMVFHREQDDPVQRVWALGEFGALTLNHCPHRSHPPHNHWAGISWLFPWPGTIPFSSLCSTQLAEQQTAEQKQASYHTELSS